MMPFWLLHLQGEQTSALSFPKDFQIRSAKAQKGWETAMETRRISRSL